jgi:hypothetical protein
LPPDAVGGGFVVRVATTGALMRLELRNPAHREYGVRLFTLELVAWMGLLQRKSGFGDVGKQTNKQTNLFCAHVCFLRVRHSVDLHKWTTMFRGEMVADFTPSTAGLPLSPCVWTGIPLQGLSTVYLRLRVLSSFGSRPAWAAVRLFAEPGAKSTLTLTPDAPPRQHVGRLHLAAPATVLRLAFFLREVLKHVDQRTLVSTNAVYFRSLSALHALVANFFARLAAEASQLHTQAVPAADIAATFKVLLPFLFYFLLSFQRSHVCLRFRCLWSKPLPMKTFLPRQATTNGFVKKKGPIAHLLSF